MTRTITQSIKFIVCLTAFAGIMNSASAQTTGGPDLFGYIWRDSNDPNGQAYNWIDIASLPGAVQVTGLADDNVRGPYAIGFPFRFYWYDVTTFRVGSNGYISFGLGAAAHPFPLIPTPTGIQNFVAGMMSDLTFTDNAGVAIPNAQCWYWSSPNSDSLIVSYMEVPFWDPIAPGYIGSNTFQIILSMADTSITFNYQTQNGIYNNPTNFCTIGIENISGNVGLQHTHDILPPSVYSIKFYYPANSTYQVNDASTVYINNETTGGLFRSKNGSPYVMSSQIKNTGNQPLAGFNVQSRVVNFLNQNQVTDNITSNALNPGDIQDLNFTNVFTPTTVGPFRHINNTQLTGDATPSNNQKELEIQVVDTTLTSIQLSFDSGIEAGLGGLAWQGGGGGAGIHFIPPFYPCRVTQMSAYIAANANLAGFAMMLLDDDGPGGTPLTVLDSVWVDPAGVIVGNWNFAPMPVPVQIDSGSFYVAWVMGADGISLGQNKVAPISNRTYEVLGQPSNPAAWADYRYREIEDLMINAYIESIPIGVSEHTPADILGNFYPNPASTQIHINYNFQGTVKDLIWKIYDLDGKLVARGNEGSVSSGTLTISAENMLNGVYLCEIDNGRAISHKKITILR